MLQTHTCIFNKVSLFNVAYVESQKIDSFDCFVWHDVDIVQTHLCNTYKCSNQPLHICANVSKYGYRCEHVLRIAVTATKEMFLLQQDGYGTFEKKCGNFKHVVTSNVSGRANIINVDVPGHCVEIEF